MSENQFTVYVGNSIKERRIDKYLHGRFSNYSRVKIQGAIKAGGVRVNGMPVKCSFQLNHGDRIDMTLPELPSKHIIPEDIPLDIIYEDDDLIIVNKPADMIVHPARGHNRGTLVNALVYYSDELSSGQANFRPGIVHRLDRNTTGVLIVAKNDEAQWKIGRQFHDRTIEKAYLAIVHGTPELSADRISIALGVHPNMRDKYAIRPVTGKEAVTFYETLEEFRGFALLGLTPKTGRTHQLRVHLSHLKHPIVADDMYDGKLVYPWQLKDEEPTVEEPVMKRTALHAAKIRFRHPTTGQHVCFEAPLPEDMQNFLDLLRKHRPV